MKASGGDAGWSKAKKRHMRMGRSAAVGSAGNIMEAAPFFNFFFDFVCGVYTHSVWDSFV